MSDHEVNIKILLDVLLRAGQLESRTARNELLRSMTDNVSELVLADNQQQALALTLDGLRSAAAYESYVAFVQESGGRRGDPSRRRRRPVPRRADGQPRARPRPAASAAVRADGTRQELGLRPRPEDRAARRPGQPPLPGQLLPRPDPERFDGQIDRHPLRREIIATGAVNYVVNKAGTRLLWALAGGNDGDTGAVMQAYLNVDAGADAPAVRTRLQAAANLTPAKEHEALLAVESLLEQAVRDVLAGGKPDLEALLRRSPQPAGS